MAGPPVPGNVQRGVVKPSNDEGRMGDKRANGFLSLGGGASTVHPSNEQTARGDKRMGSFPLSESMGAVRPPNHEFQVGMAKMPQPNSAIEPGKGAVPVNPFSPDGSAMRSVPMRESAK